MKRSFPSPSLAALREILEGHFGLSATEDLASLLAAPRTADNPLRRFLIRRPEMPLRFRVAERLDLDADAIILDYQLGTLGLIHWIADESETAAQESVTARIGEASYLRHLFLEDLRPGEPQAGRKSFSIELVFIADHEDSMRWLGNHLQEAVRGGTPLLALGISILPGLPAVEDPNRGSILRRGFSWLLHETRAWLDENVRQQASAPELPAPGEGDGKGPRPVRGTLQAVALTDFRLAGRRQWPLSTDHMLQVIHGPNGSGKSSLVEALELVATGRIERLRSLNPRQVLTHRGLAEPGAARIEISFEGETLAWQVTDSGIDREQLSENLPAASFRLNFDIASRLARADEKEIGQFFFSTYFPEGAGLALKVESNRKEAADLLAGVPTRLRASLVCANDELDTAAARSQLAWTAESSVDWSSVLALLPIDVPTVQVLLPLLPESFTSHFHRTGAVPWADALASAKVMDAGLAELTRKIPGHLESAAKVREFLKVSGESGSRSFENAQGSLAELLNDWLGWVAITDMLETEDRLIGTLELLGVDDLQAIPAGFRPVMAGFKASPDGPARATQLVTARACRATAFREVEAHRSAEQIAAQRHGLPPIESLDLTPLDILAQAGALGAALRQTDRSLGDAVREAFTQHTIVPVKTAQGEILEVGTPGWGRQLLADLNRTADALEKVQASAADLTGNGRLETLLGTVRRLHGVATELEGRHRVAFDALMKRLSGPLGGALTELTAMLTPARWAYADIISQADVHDNAVGLRFLQDQVPAALRLNTAQTCTLALSFFLLCTRARWHPLRLGLLDDPFENMDELTVTTVARGLGRLLRLRRSLGDDERQWRLVLLLHGEQNVERVRQEIPCSVAFLPWLSPGAVTGGNPATMEVQPSWMTDELEDLAALVRPLDH